MSAQSAHKIDSLKKELSLAKNEERFLILSQLFEETKLHDFAQALEYANQYADLAATNGDSLKIVLGLRMRAFTLLDFARNDEAATALTQALSIVRRNRGRIPEMEAQLKFILNNTGLAYMYLGDYPTALNFHYESLQIREREGDKKSIRAALNNIGLIFYNVGDFTRAIQYYERATAISQELHDFGGQELVATNLSLCYTAVGENAKSNELLEETLGRCGNNCDENILKEIFFDLGLVNHNRKFLEQGKKWLHRSLVIARKQGDVRRVGESLLELAKIENELKNEKQYLAYLTEATSIAEAVKLARLKLGCYSAMSTLFQNQKDYEKALAYQRKYGQLVDSLYGPGLIRNFTNVQTGYEQKMNLKIIEEKEQLLVLQKEAIDRQQKQFYLSLAIAVLITILLSVSLFFGRKLRHQNKEIMVKNQELVSLNLEKNNLIGIVAHDLKSPLNQIKGLLSLVKMTGTVDVESAKFLELMDQSAARLSEMIAKILDVEAIESKQLNLKIEKLNLAEILHRIADRYENDASKKSITINKQIDSPVLVDADRGYMEQVLENLLSNAIKFSPFQKSIFVILTSAKGKAICEIRDERPGLNDNDKKSLFGKYQKLSAKPTGNENSTGLGLSIVKKFVETMKGEIWCESQEGKGASFFVKFGLST